MSRLVRVHRAPYDNSEKLYSKAHHEIQPGVTVLVGCNGSGKSTFLRCLLSQLEDEDIPVMSYNNEQQGGSYSFGEDILYGQYARAATLMCSSEGEKIYINVGKFANKLGRFVSRNKGAKEIWILLDGIDSGVSIDTIADIKSDLFPAIIESQPNSDVYIIVSANTYEMCAEQNCYDVRLGKYRTFKSYEAYKKFILKSRQSKDARYNKQQ